MKLKALINKHLLFDVLFALLAFTLPLSFALPNIFLLLLFLLFVLKKTKERFNTYLNLVLIFSLFFILKALLNKELIENFFSYKHLIVFVVLSFLSFNVKNLILVKKAFVFGTLFAVVISLFNITSYYLQHNFVPLGNTAQAAELLIIHRPYFGFICLLAIVCSVDLTKGLKHTKEANFFKFFIFLFVGFVYLIVARLALVLIIIYIFSIVIKQYSFSAKKLVLFVGFTLGLLLLLVLNNENLKKRLHIENSFDQTIKVMANQEPRVVIWDCFFTLIKKPSFNHLIGYKNNAAIQLDLNECYKNSIDNSSKNAYYQETKFNTHNQFFDFYLQGGIIGFLLFVIIFGYSLYANRFHLTTLFIIISFISFLFIENLFHRQLGVYLIGIFIPLFMKKNTQKKLHEN